MPQIYRRHSDYQHRPEQRRHPLPQPTDADDSIVLSDLVRTGEASRLRRRGAMRLDHNSARSAVLPPPPSTSAPSRPIIMPPSRPSTPPWVTSDPVPEDEYTYAPAGWGDWSTEDVQLQEDESVARQGPGAYPDDEQPVMLLCGGLVKSSKHHEPFQPSPLPTFPPKRSASSKSSSSTNGCGAVVHMQAFPQGPRGVWVGKEDATSTVVGLESSYFDRNVVAKMLKSACGCVREGIGCAICGNTLGTRYTPCQAASAGIFACSSVPSCSATSPLHPSGPRYWDCTSTLRSQASSSSSSSSNTFYVYTFFSDHVTPAPTYHKPPRAPSPASLSLPWTSLQSRLPITREAPAMRRGDTPPAAVFSPEFPPTMEDRMRPYFTTSPRPLTPAPLPLSATREERSDPGLTASPAGEPFLYGVPPPSTSRGQLELETSIPPSLRRVRRIASREVNAQAILDLDLNDPNRVDSGEGEGEREERTEVVELDADGVVVGVGGVGDEPSSPDKIVNEVVWPGR